MNLYAFCEDDPVNKTDPMGESWLGVALGAAIGVAAFIPGVNAVAALCAGVYVAVVDQLLDDAKNVEVNPIQLPVDEDGHVHYSQIPGNGSGNNFTDGNGCTE